jgi:hypothetical protein
VADGAALVSALAAGEVLVSQTVKTWWPGQGSPSPTAASMS